MVLFSGGQDSATCLAWALDRFDHVETVGFFYGQRHRVELEARQVLRAKLPGIKDWRGELGEDHLIALEALGEISGSAMTEEIEIRIAENGLPNTFLPGRNLAFLVMAGALAYRRGTRTLIGGMCETDYSGYPDCRAAPLSDLLAAMRGGMECNMQLETPLMKLSKAESWKLADEIAGDPLTDLIIEESHSCYIGDRSKRHAWGYGCGECPACELRAAGWQAWRDSP